MCPPPDLIAPCTCSETTLFYIISITLFLYCNDKGLHLTKTDKVSEILDNFSSAVGSDGLGVLDIAENRLKIFPARLKKNRFRSLSELFMQGNSFNALKARSFNFIAILGQITLNENKLASIEPGTFKGLLIKF